MLTIAQVERETGLSKDVLRVWERRYGFPAPHRSEAGDRLYDAAQLERLRLIKRLMDRGYRPGRLFAMPAGEVEQLASSLPAGEAESDEVGSHQTILERILAGDAQGLRTSLSQLLAKQGLQRFVQDSVSNLNEKVGNGWASGLLAVHQEHLYAEEMSRLLRSAIASLPSGGRPPRILLTTLAGEAHGLGLLQAEGMLAPEGAQCISLGLQTPGQEIVRAIGAYDIDVLALSFSVVFSPRQGLAELQSLRARLPARVEIWAGGGMVRSLAKLKVPGVLWTPELSDCLTRLADWRSRHADRV